MSIVQHHCIIIHESSYGMFFFVNLEISTLAQNTLSMYAFSTPLQNVLYRLTVAIQKTKEKEAEEGLADVVEQGWLIKEGPNESRRKRYSFLNVFRI